MATETPKIYVQLNGKKQEAKGEILEQLLQARLDFEAEQSRIEAEQQAKAQAKASAKAKLKALGLTDSEVEGLING